MPENVMPSLTIKRPESPKKPTVRRRKKGERPSETKARMHRLMGGYANPFLPQLQEAEIQLHEVYERETYKMRRDAKNLTDMDKFDKIISSDKKEADKEKVYELREKQKKLEEEQPFHKRYPPERALLAEYLFDKYANASKWFGENTTVTKTLEFDDRTHHADGVATWYDKNGKVLARLAFDVTISRDPEVLSKKQGFIDRDLKEGNLTSVDYFDPNNILETKSSLKQIPRVVIEVPQEDLPDLCKKAMTGISKDGKIDYSVLDDDSIRQYIKKVSIKSLQNQQKLLEDLSIVSSHEKREKFEQALKNVNKALSELHKL